MLSPLKHRIIGTIVVVALLVIILPDLFDGKKEPVKEQFNSIPFAPEPADEKPLMIDLSQSSAAPAAPAAPVASTNSTAVTQPDVKPSSPVSSFSDSAWIIQLATLKSSEGTNQLIDKLQKAGFQAHSYPRIPVDGELNRIFIGPEVSKDSLEKQLNQLQKLTGLKGLIRRFEPLDQ
ncbi:SPOR domain-containing protein [Celerinatantimonas sp. YJH-8]|uniref:SPOR domain-containing protein n=1 Tax=Celerinatantimonas sp. YJH-8 TaxID=3228714 RepID=UPI0038C74266